MRFSPGFFCGHPERWGRDEAMMMGSVDFVTSTVDLYMLGSGFFLVGATKGQDIKTSKVAAGYDKMEFV